MKPTQTIVKQGMGVKVTIQLWGAVTPERLAREQAIAEHRLDQLIPQPKIEFERDPEDYDE